MAIDFDAMIEINCSTIDIGADIHSALRVIIEFDDLQWSNNRIIYQFCMTYDIYTQLMNQDIRFEDYFILPSSLLHNLITL